MPTQFIHRLIIICPVAKVAAVVAWFQANIDPNAVAANLGPELNSTGLFADPATHNWCCGSFNDADTKKILVKCCQLASIAVPTVTQWDNATRQQKINWLHSVQAGLLSGFGIWVTLADNTGQWDDPTAALAAMGLKVRAAS